MSCSKMLPHQLTQDELYNDEDIGLWSKIIELYSCNNRLRSDGGVQESSENNTCTGIEPAQNPEMRENQQENRPDQELTDR